MRVLLVDDVASTAPTLVKLFSDTETEITVIYWESGLLSKTRSIPSRYLQFKSERIVDSAKEIVGLSKSYDIFLCYGWRSAIVCYIANVNYIYHGTGNDIRNLEKYTTVRSWIERVFYKMALRSASMILVGTYDFVDTAIRYNKRIKFDKVLLDTTVFTPQGEKFDLKRGKFVFFCPQRLEWSKGYRILWEAINLTKSDFVVLQCDWGKLPDYAELLTSMPSKVELIPVIKRQDMPKYYRSVDAILGSFEVGVVNSVEREAVACHKAVITYSTEYRPEQKNHPFLRTNDPSVVAAMIDRLVEDNHFREELEEKQHLFVQNNYGVNECLSGWKSIFDEATTISCHKVPRRFVLGVLGVLEKYIQLTNVSSNKYVNNNAK